MPRDPKSADNGFSRRRFLQGSSTVAAAAALGTLVRPVHAAGDDTLKLALVGCGNRGTGAIANALQTSAPVKLWAMADAFEDRLAGSLNVLTRGGQVSQDTVSAEISSRVDVPPERQFIGLDAYKHAIDLADVVLLVGPPGFRPEQFEYAVEHGKHVFMEKPVATDGPGVRRVLAAGKKAREQRTQGRRRPAAPSRSQVPGNHRPPARWRHRRHSDAALLLERRHDQTARRP